MFGEMAWRSCVSLRQRGFESGDFFWAGCGGVAQLRVVEPKGLRGPAPGVGWWHVPALHMAAGQWHQGVGWWHSGTVYMAAEQWLVPACEGCKELGCLEGGRLQVGCRAGRRQRGPLMLEGMASCSGRNGMLGRHDDPDSAQVSLHCVRENPPAYQPTPSSIGG